MDVRYNQYMNLVDLVQLTRVCGSTWSPSKSHCLNISNQMLGNGPLSAISSRFFLTSINEITAASPGTNALSRESSNACLK